MPYFFSESESDQQDKLAARNLAESFAQTQFFGQLVGPHGSGKTTLAFAIARELQDHFSTVDYAIIRGGGDVICERKRDSNSVGFKSTDTRLKRFARLMILDGIERLSFLQQRILIHNVLTFQGEPKRLVGAQPPANHSRLRNGLLITSHVPVRFCPIIERVQPNFSIFKKIVEYVAPGTKMPDAVALDIYEKAGQNQREAIMLAYDWIENANLDVSGVVVDSVNS